MTARRERYPVAVRIALRELRGGLRGFRIFLACLILGVAAIAGVGSLTEGLTLGMREKGQELLAGDVEIRLFREMLNDEQLAYIEATGRLSRVAQLRAMARSPRTDERTLVELKAVEDNYPLYGTLALEPAQSRDEAFAERNGLFGAAIEPELAARLNVGVGDILRVGEADLEIRAIIERQPDKANEGFPLGPTVMANWRALDATKLVRLGSLINYFYKLALPAGTTVEQWRENLDAAFPKEDWRVRDHTGSAPGTRRFLNQMGSFLTLVGLTALIIGGVGVGNAVRAYLDNKTNTIATLKILGADGGMVFKIYLIQVMALALVAVAAGLLIGLITPAFLSGLLSDRIPVPPQLGLYTKPLATAALYGVLITLAFTVWPLGKARDVPAARLMRSLVAPQSSMPRRQYILLVVGSVIAVVTAAVALADDWQFAAGFAGTSALILAVLYGIGWGIQIVAARLPRVRHPLMRMAIANLHRPHSATAPVVLSLGLGLTLFSVLAVVEGNLSAQVQENIPDQAPAFFFIDIQPHELDDFVETARSVPGVGELVTVPSLRGPITHVDGVPADQLDPENSGWILRGDRGLSYSTNLPEGNELMAGDWWPADYDGPPQISFAYEEGRDLGLDVGDTVTINVLGREVTAEIASLRRINWGTFGFNFVILFDPNTLKNAPHTYMATLQADGPAEARAHRVLTDSFPSVTAVRMKQVLASVNEILNEIGLAVRFTGAITIIAGVLVLAGALAAGHRHRVYDSVILKVLGARRADVLKAYVIEYTLLGLVTGLVALFLSVLPGYIVVTQVMELDGFRLLPWSMGGTVSAAVVITVIFGLVGTWAALGARPIAVLRTQ